MMLKAALASPSLPPLWTQSFILIHSPTASRGSAPSIALNSVATPPPPYPSARPVRFSSVSRKRIDPGIRSTPSGKLLSPTARSIFIRYCSMDRAVGDSNLPEGVDLMPGSILFLDTDENLTGLALGYGGGGVATLFKAIEGADPREAVGLWIKMNDWVHKGGNEGEANAALSIIDVALWDLKAKIAGEPVWQTLGAREGRVKAYASGLDYCLSDEELFAFYRRMAELGVDGGKLKVGLDVQADLRRLGIMREALSIASAHPRLMIDSNEYWSPKQAVRYIRKMEERFDLVWVEEPARRWDYDGLRLGS